MKKLFLKIKFGVALGCFAFVAMLFIGSAFAGGPEVFIGRKTGEELLRTAGFFILIATGYSIPSLIYEKEALALGLKALVHMVAGTIIFLIVSFLAGWIKNGFGAVALYILIAITAAAFFWAVFMIVFKLQADKINKKLREKQHTS